MSKSSNKWIGITLGDPGGIGPEVVAKAFNDPATRHSARFILIGDYPVYKKYSSILYPTCIFEDVKHTPLNRLKIGRPSKEGAQASLIYLNRAIQLLKAKEISSLVTAPVCKETISSIDKNFVGHTEYLAENFKVKEVGMMFVSKKFRIMLVTHHIPLNKVSAFINQKNILETIKLSHLSLKRTFKIQRPRIAVCGLNPHAGEKGILGKEEITKIIPAIKQAQRDHINVQGPFAADTLFAPRITQHFDAIIAMYHDQGLIPAKALDFSHVVNLTVGLSFIRTSPAHGTAFDIAGKNKADPSSMKEAIKLASRLSA